MNTAFRFCVVLLIVVFNLPCLAVAQQIRFSGQASGWLQYAPDLWMNFSAGGRYIPQLNARIPLKRERLFDFEASAHIFGTMDARLFSYSEVDGKIKGYRGWARYSNHRMELRLGLQKINFGSAQMLRPLMWFDRIDPRDPLQLTDGVKALLWRYYFLNNANIWVWGLYGNSSLKGYEVTPTVKRVPEAGGRLQLPLPKGEVALSYHFRTTDPANLSFPGTSLLFDQMGEHKVGFDVKVDVGVGLWLEAAWTRFNRNMGIYTHQEMVTVGTDYTFGIGNGLAAVFEQFIYANDQDAFTFSHNTTYSAFSLSYPLNIFDHLSAMTFYNWRESQSYFFLTWQKQLNHFSCYVMGYWNPQTFTLPAMGNNTNRFAGKGVQMMVVWNH